MNIDTPNFINLNKEDFEVLHRSKNSNNFFCLHKKKQKRYSLIILFIASIISLIIIISIISFWRSTSNLNKKYYELLDRYNKIKIEKEQLFQYLGNEIKSYKETQKNVDEAKEKKKNLQEQYERLQNENVVIIKELSVEMNKEEEIIALTKSLKDQRQEIDKKREKEYNRNRDRYSHSLLNDMFLQHTPFYSFLEKI